MRRLLFLIVLVFFLPIKVYAKEVRYDINSIYANEDSIEIIGWAYIYEEGVGKGYDHGLNVNSSYPKYYLELYDEDNHLVEVFPASNNNESYTSLDDNDRWKIDLTCTVYYHTWGNYKEIDGTTKRLTLKNSCFAVLDKKNNIYFKGENGPLGTYLMVEESRTNPNWYRNFYYRNVGFRFILNFEDLYQDHCLPHFEKKEYRMKIRVETIDALKGLVSSTSDYINFLEDRVKGPRSDEIITHQAKGRVLINLATGQVRLNVKQNRAINEYWLRPNGSRYVFEYNDYIIADEVNIKDFYPGANYRLIYYGVYGRATGTEVVPSTEGAYLNVRHLGDNAPVKISWAPGTWIVPVVLTASNTRIVPPCTCNPDIEDCDINILNLNCSTTSKRVNLPSINKVELTNRFCEIRCTEQLQLNLPANPGTLKAGTGFSYNINYSVQKACDYYPIEYEVDEEELLLIEEEVKECEDWGVSNNFNIHPSMVINDSISMEEKTRSLKEKDQFNIAYDLSFGLRTTYIEKYTGQLSHNRNFFTDYYYGGDKYYTELDAISGSYNWDLVMSGLGDYHTSNIIYNCDYNVINEFPTVLDPRYPGDAYLFRPISLHNPFPNREARGNWKGYEHLAGVINTTNNLPIYNNSNLIYRASITPENIIELKAYNDNYPYLNMRFNGRGGNLFLNEFSRLFDDGGGAIR